MSSPGQADALDQLGAAFDEAAEEGYLGEKPQAPDDDAIRARLRVVGGYLFLLGYLKGNPSKVYRGGRTGTPLSDQVFDSDIKKAVGTFQRDAGLADDGWVGSETWDALQELASFEHPTNIARWFAGNEPRPVLWRAVYLRLFAFGLTKLAPRPGSRLKNKNKQRDSDFQGGLDGFVRAARLLRLADGELEPALVPTTLNVLFDQDGICERANAYLNNPDEAPAGKEDRRHAEEFLDNTARIELWLYGYNLKIGNFKDKGPFVRPDQFTQSFASAMSDFGKDHGQDRNFCALAKKGSIDVLIWFFGRLAALYRGSPDTETMEDADEVVDKVLRDTKIGQEVQGTIKSLGARLWDGVKRAWNWIKSLFKNLFNTVKKIAKRIVTNISRFIHEAALKVCSHALAAVRAVVDGVNFLKEKVLLGSDPKHMVVMHDKDLDFDVFVNSAADPVVVANLSERIELRSEIFAVGAKIVSSLTSFLLSIIRDGVTTGWFALMLALVRLYRAIKHLREFSRRALDLITQLDALRAQA